MIFLRLLALVQGPDSDQRLFCLSGMRRWFPFGIRGFTLAVRLGFVVLLDRATAGQSGSNPEPRQNPALDREPGSHSAKEIEEFHRPGNLSQFNGARRAFAPLNTKPLQGAASHDVLALEIIGAHDREIHSLRDIPHGIRSPNEPEGPNDLESKPNDYRASPNTHPSRGIQELDRPGWPQPPARAWPAP
jgi:hypothetical protein